MSALLLAVVLGAVAHEAPPPDEDRVKTLVVALEVRRLDESLSDTLTDVALAALARQEHRTALGPRDLAAVIGVEADKQAVGCSDASCLSEIASAIDVDTLITGSVDAIGDGFVVILNEIDARTVRPLARVQKTARDEAGLLDAINAAVDELVEKTSGKVVRYGRLSVTTVPSRRPVTIDGRSAGMSPLVVSLPVGTHVVEVAGKKKHVPARFDVEVRRGAQSEAHIETSVEPEVSPEEWEAYESDSFWHSTWAYTKVGGGSLGLVLSSCGLIFTGLVWFGFLSAITNPTAAPYYTPFLTVAYGSFVAVLTLFWVGFCAGTLGATGWGIWDLKHPVERPTAPDAVHRVTLTEGGGAPREVDLPAQRERKPARDMSY